jgi:hypothetical protein
MVSTPAHFAQLATLRHGKYYAALNEGYGTTPRLAVTLAAKLACLGVLALLSITIQ